MSDGLTAALDRGYRDWTYGDPLHKLDLSALDAIIEAATEHEKCEARRKRWLRPCVACSGMGDLPGEDGLESCPTCHGSGMVEDTTRPDHICDANCWGEHV